MERGITVARLGLGNGESEVEHETNRLIVGVGFPTVAWQKLEINAGQVGDDAGMLAHEGFCFRSTSQNAAHEQTGLRVALFVKKVKQTLMAFEKCDLVRIGIEGESPLQDSAAAALVADGRESDSRPMRCAGQAGF